MNNNGNNNNGNNGGNNNSNQKKNGGFFTLFMFLMLLCLAGFWIFRMFSNNTDKTIEYNEFLTMAEEGKIDKVVIGSDRIIIYPKPEAVTEGNGVMLPVMNKNTVYTGKIEEDETVAKRMLDYGIEVSGEIPDNSGEIWIFILSYVLPIVLIAFFGIILMRRLAKSDGIGGFMNVGKNTAKVYVQKETGITFKEVAGEDEAIESLQEVVDFLHNPDRYVKIGAKLPKGALLVGPPGTGKTLLAKAVAGEAHVPFFSLTGSDFVEMYVGVGASRVRDLFREAEKNAPCIIFIDEIDAIGRSRDSKYGGGNEEREQTLNQLLSEMDGFDGKKGIIILAATNRFEILDKALLRPGRFDRRIIVDKPDLKGRVEILKVHAKNVRMDETVDLNEIALATSGAVGSDLANMINEAAILAVKSKREFVSQKDLFNAVEIVLMGKEKKDRVLNEKERKIVSYHEVGHALVAAVQKNSEPVKKITIVPRTMGALGYVMHVPEEETYLKSKEELHDQIVGYMGGRAAEEVVFHSVTTGASNDIEQATNIARSMVTRYGMSDKFGLVGLETVESRYLDQRLVMNCAGRTAADVDNEVIAILKGCYDEAVAILTENREIMDKLADYLIQKETITGQEFMEIYCKEKGIPVPEPKDPFEDKKKKKEEGEDASVKEEIVKDGVIYEKTVTEEPRMQESKPGEPEKVEPTQANRNPEDFFKEDRKEVSVETESKEVKIEETSKEMNTEGEPSSEKNDDFASLLKNRNYRDDNK